MNTPDLTSIQEANAPWNEDHPLVEFSCDVSQTLSKTTTLHTYEYEDDEDGFAYPLDVDFEQDFDDEHYTPLQLIEEFQSLLQNMKDAGSVSFNSKYANLLEECEGWVEDDLEVIVE